MTVIDVKSGSARDNGGIASVYLETNLAACETIAAQIRLRNLGGMILIILEFKTGENSIWVCLRARRGQNEYSLK